MIPLFNQQLSSNGLVSFNTSFPSHIPQPFPLDPNRAVVAPYWDDIHLTGSRQLRYQIVSGTSSVINQVNSFLTSHSGVAFNANWILWAYWYNVCPFTDRNCDSHEVSKACTYIYIYIMLTLQ